MRIVTRGASLYFSLGFSIWIQSYCIFMSSWASSVLKTVIYTSFYAVTPPDYQPPGFKDGDCEGVIFDGDPTYLNVGEVPTPFYNSRLKVTTEKERMENIDSTILKPKESRTQFEKILRDKDDVEDEKS